MTASQTVALARLRVLTSSDDVPPLELADNAGLVWLDECVTTTSIYVVRAPGLRASRCADVVLNRSSFKAAVNHNGILGDPTIAPAGLDLASSAVHAYDCVFVGADGKGLHSPPNTAAQRGGAGIRASTADAFLFLSHCTALGGDGLYYDPSRSSWPSCSAGGPGLETVSRAHVLDSALFGGAGGLDFEDEQCAANGPAWSGPIGVLDGDGLSFAISQLGREGENVTFTLQGPPFRAVYLIGGPVASPQFVPMMRGPLLVGTPRVTQFLGFTDGTGQLAVVRSIGFLPPSLDIRRLYLQPYYFEPGAPTPARELGQYGHATLGAGALYVVLDESF